MPTEQVLPEDAIVGLPGEPRFPDAAMFLLAMLRREWNAKATSGITPDIDFAEDMKGFDFRDNGQILVYITSERTEPATVDYLFKNEYVVVSLDFYAPREKRQLVKMVREAERIVDSIRRDVYNPATGDALDPDISGRQWLRWGVRLTPFDRTTRGFYRRTVEVEVLWRFRRIVDADPNC